MTAVIPGQRAADLNTAIVLNEKLCGFNYRMNRYTVTITIPGTRPVLAKMAAGIFLVMQH